jgi:hypothetical protein
LQFLLLEGGVEAGIANGLATYLLGQLSINEE